MTSIYPTAFPDSVLETLFSRDGYVVVPLFSHEQTRSLANFYNEAFGAPSEDFFSTIFLPDSAQRREATEELRRRLEEPILSFLPDYELCAQAFIVKRGGVDQGPLVQHQDYTFVDQSQHRAIHLWCPLLDVDESNGCLNVVAGSHDLVTHISAIPTNPSPYDEVRTLLKAECTTLVPMKAGSAVLFDERLMHGSEPNRSSDLRIAIGAALLPRGVKRQIYVADPLLPSKLDVLEVVDEFAVRLVPGLPVEKPYPDGLTYLSTITYEPTQLTSADIQPLRVLQAEHPSVTPQGKPLVEASQESLLKRAIKGWTGRTWLRLFASLKGSKSTKVD